MEQLGNGIEQFGDGDKNKETVMKQRRIYIVLLFCLFLCACQKEKNFALAPAFQYNDQIYQHGPASNLHTLPEGYKKTGTVEKEIQASQWPDENGTINRRNYEGCEVFQCDEVPDMIYIKKDDIYYQWIVRKDD